MKKIIVFAVVLAMATTMCVVAGAGVAGADVVLSVSPGATGLTDGQTVTVTVSGLTPSAFATVFVSECGNAYADGSPLASVDTSVGSRDCEVIGYTAAGGLSSATSVDFVQPIKETGIGTGNRACNPGIEATPCVVYISQSVNEGGTHASVDISFAAPASGAGAAATETSIGVNGAPLAVSKDAYARVEVHRVDDGVVPEGSVSVSLDGTAAGSAPVGLDGTATILVAAHNSLSLGTHTIHADYSGNGSFLASSSADITFSIIEDLNISIGDGSVVNETSGAANLPRTITFPVILSQPPTVPLTVNYTTADGSAVAGTDYVKLTGHVLIKTGTSRLLTVKILANPGATIDKNFSVVLSAPLAGIGGGYVLRVPVGTGTILHDTSTAPESVSIGDGEAAEGDTGLRNTLKFSVTLSSPAPTKLHVLFTVSDGTTTHHSKLVQGDWNGSLHPAITFPAGKLSTTLSIMTYPDLAPEPNETLKIDIDAVCTSGISVAKCVSAGSSVVIARGTAVGTILSDE